MPVRVTADWNAPPELRGTTDSWPSEKLGTARALLAQTNAKAHPWPVEALSSTLAAGAAGCSGISHSCWSARSGENRHATDPARGCSWNSRRRAATKAVICLKANAVVTGKEDLAATRARGVGLYYRIRSLAITPAAVTGGILWNAGPEVPFLLAGVIGLVGTTVFAATVDERYAA